MARALIVGIDHYKHGNRLFGCVNDAHNVKAVLERHDGGLVNFDCKLLTATCDDDQVTRANLKDGIEELFSQKTDIALLYFAGHGHIESTGGYILASDSKRGDEGVSLSEIMTIVNNSPVTNKVIVLDSCHSGIAAAVPGQENLSAIGEGVTILTASTAEQYSSEEDGSGVFTNLFVDALSGSAANLVGDVTPGSVYAHIDQSLGEWEQRPVFKTNVRQFVSLRKVKTSIDYEDLVKIKDYFPNSGYEFQLDPTFEPEIKGREPDMPPPDPTNTTVFDILQKYNRVGLLIPVGAKHMWNAAMESKCCKLTALGEHYRRLCAKGRI